MTLEASPDVVTRRAMAALPTPRATTGPIGEIGPIEAVTEVIFFSGTARRQATSRVSSGTTHPPPRHLDPFEAVLSAEASPVRAAARTAARSGDSMSDSDAAPRSARAGLVPVHGQRDASRCEDQRG